MEGPILGIEHSKNGKIILPIREFIEAQTSAIDCGLFTVTPKEQGQPTVTLPSSYSLARTHSPLNHQSMELSPQF